MTDPTLLEQALDVLVGTSSASGTEAGLAEELAAFARGRGLEASVLPVGPGRASVLATRDHGPGPHVVLSGHVDTLPLPESPKGAPSPGRQGDRYIGAEVNNMKGAVAGMLAAMVALADDPTPGRVTLLAAASECDTIGLGTVSAIPELGHVDAAINGEPTDLEVLQGHAGVARIRLRACGRSAHISQVGLGRNAIGDLVAVLAGLSQATLGAEEHPQFPGLPLVNMGVVHGGIAPSMLAAEATADLDIRWHPGMTFDGIVAALEAHVDAAGLGATVSIEPHEPPEFFQPGPYLLDPDWPVVDAVRDAHAAVSGRPCAVRFAVPQVYYGSDAPHLVAAGIPTVIYGPGKAEDINRPAESIAWQDVVDAADVYEAACRSLLLNTA